MRLAELRAEIVHGLLRIVDAEQRLPSLLVDNQQAFRPTGKLELVRPRLARGGLRRGIEAGRTRAKSSQLGVHYACGSY